jgi:hypothetical protein
MPARSATQIPIEDLIELGFVVPNADEVREFLAGHTEIATLLVEAMSVIPRYFGEGTPVLLLIQDDPDGWEDRYIAAHIRTALDPTEAFERLHKMRQDWWLTASKPHGEEVLLSLDLVQA